MSPHLLKLLAVTIVLSSLTGPAAGSRGLLPSDHLTIEARLAGEGLGDCWNALLDLQSCTNEIVLFFLNGESHLRLDCCRDIRVITHQCMPSVLTSIGFTVQEGDILCGYCDAEVPNVVPPPANPPVSSPVADADGTLACSRG